MRHFIAFFSLLVCVGCNAPQSAATRSQNDPVIQAAIAAVKAETIVKDFLYEPAAWEEWNIGVLDNGTDREGLAQYFCTVLSEKRAVSPLTRVRIVDALKVYLGTPYRKATLGYVHCNDRVPVYFKN